MSDSQRPFDELPDFETICAHYGEDRDRYMNAVIPPIFQNSTFTGSNSEERSRQWAENKERAKQGLPPLHHSYTRVTNPTTDITEVKIAALEKGEQARCFGSGMAAIVAAILSSVKAGDHVVAAETAYGPTRSFLDSYLKRFNISVTFIDGVDPREWADAIQPNTTVFYLESPSSFVFKQQDFSALYEIANPRGIATICDNSWASPYFQNPLDWGVDLVVHSATKYLGGHSDIVAGVVVGKRERMAKLVENEGALLGGILDPFAAWLLMRGLRTLPIRMDRHQQTTRRIACSLLEHPAVANVYYPGLPNDPQPELTQRQLRGTSGLFSFELKKQTRAATYGFVDSLRYFGQGPSWGGFESLITPITLPERIVGGKTDDPRWIIRLSIGLESADDIWNDIDNALKVSAG